MSDINSRQSSELIESKHNAFTGSDKDPLRKVAYFIPPCPFSFPRGSNTQLNPIACLNTVMQDEGPYDFST